MKNIFLFVAIMLLGLDLMGQTYQTFQVRPNQAVGQSKLADKPAYHYSRVSTPWGEKVKETRPDQYVSRYQGYNGAKDTVVVVTTPYSYSYVNTYQVYTTPQMVDAKSTAKAGTVSGYVPMIPQIPNFRR